jgi:Asp/Glu/hydantoin racemase
MRIAYQSFGPATNTAYLGALSEQLGRIGARQSAKIDLKTVSGARIGAKQYRSLQHLDIAMITRHAYVYGSSYDAVVLGNIQDPGLVECRQLLDCPVVGLLEGTLALTQPFGSTVALVLTHRRVQRTVNDLIDAYGMRTRIHSITTIDADLSAISDGFVEIDGAAARAIEAFVLTAQAALYDGADLVVPAAGLLAALVEKAKQSPSDFPDLVELTTSGEVLCPVEAACAYAVGAAALAGSGQKVSRRGAYERPDLREIDAYFESVARLSAGPDLHLA